ncbi:Gfo/Idh/MocA family oxidoreductase [archaeon]|jgi:predicted dehydrogenase|nr:Gfo/Idh/MocA family oxidoreductase [archaeon]
MRRNLHIIGGLGEVSMARKLPLLFETDLSKKLNVATILDIHPRETIENPGKFIPYIRELSEKRFGTPAKLETMYKLGRRIQNGKTKYVQLRDGQLGADIISGIDPEDCVDISCPNYLHYNFFHQTMTQTPANILMEKPLVGSVEELEKLQLFANEIRKSPGNRTVMDAEHYFYYKIIQDYLGSFKNKKTNRHKLGKIETMILRIEEETGFETQRNKDIITRTKSGGGIGLDMGIHAISLLNHLGARIDYDTIKATPIKNSELIRDDKYGENEMRVECMVYGENFHTNGCDVRIRVAKNKKNARKAFYFGHENGMIDLNMGEKIRRTYGKEANLLEEKSYGQQDAFYNVLNSFTNYVDNGLPPPTSIQMGIKNLKDIFEIYRRAGPIQMVLN